LQTKRAGTVLGCTTQGIKRLTLTRFVKMLGEQNGWVDTLLTLSWPTIPCAGEWEHKRSRVTNAKAETDHVLEAFSTLALTVEPVSPTAGCTAMR
jgi:hypothetical protein